MTGFKLRFGRALTAGAIATGMVGVGVAVAPAASAAGGTTLRVAITKYGMYVNGPHTFPAGRVAMFLDAAGGDRGVDIVKFASGYTWKNYRNDLKVAFGNLFAPGGDTKKGLKALNHAIAHSTFFGGLYSPAGQVRHGLVLLKQPGRYILFDDSGNLPRRPTPLTVTAASGPQTLPSTTATVFAKTTRRFGGADTLPHHGTITFANHATNSPHFLVLQHVKEGTTRKQVLDSFQSQGPPTFALPDEQESDVVSPGHAMNLHLHLPVGEYAEMCFFPDPQTGMPHAFMGMVRIIHLT
jgi:hypothetical protein